MTLIKKELQELKAHQNMICAQELMHENPGNRLLGDVELEVVKEYNFINQAHLEFLQHVG